jgi:8-oxo-dGTP pyrophosphatase MutT (NUDIX family)
VTNDVVGRQHADTVAVLTRLVEATGDREQHRMAAEILDYVVRHPDATTRACRPDHVTASALVITPDAARVMLDLHGKVNRWLQFGGHVEPTDVGLADAALREAVEESGCTDLRLWSATPVTVDIHPAPCGARRHLDVQFVAIAGSAARPVAGAESHAVAWFDVDGLPDGTDDSVRRLVAQAVERVLGSAVGLAPDPSGAPTPSS